MVGIDEKSSVLDAEASTVACNVDIPLGVVGKAALSVLNCRGPACRLRNAAWYSALKGTTWFEGDGVLLRAIERQFLPVWRIGLVRPRCEDDCTERLLWPSPPYELDA